MIQRIILTFLVLAASFSTARADKILCRVLDAETKDPIPEAIVKYDRTNGTTRWFDIATTDSLGYLVNVGARSNRGNIWQTTLTISFLGYTPETINFVQGDNPNDTLRLADVLLRPSPPHDARGARQGASPTLHDARRHGGVSPRSLPSRRG